MRKILSVSLAISIAAFSLNANTVTADAVTTDLSQELIEIIESNPTDYAGIDMISRELTGQHYWVKLPGLAGEVTGTEATNILATTNNQKTPRANLPIDTFSIAIGRATVASGVYVTGSVIFKSTYAGQAAPFDYSSLQFNIPDCMSLTGHSIKTYSGTGALTGLGFLSNANLANDAPIWRIDDKVSGFTNLAHRSAASVLVSKSGCSGASTVQAAYIYEHNQVGTVSSVSASFGILSLVYSNTPLKLKKSSSVMTWNW